MALIRVIAKMDKEGRIRIPVNIRKKMGLRAGQVLAIKVSGSNPAQFLVIRKQDSMKDNSLRRTE